MVSLLQALLSQGALLVTSKDGISGLNGKNGKKFLENVALQVGVDVVNEEIVKPAIGEHWYTGLVSVVLVSMVMTQVTSLMK